MKLDNAKSLVDYAIEEFQPTYIASMVSGGKDSACSHAVAEELGVKIDFVIHGYTGCGIPETTQFVIDNYSHGKPHFLIADAGTTYEDYVLRKGFFGKGIFAHQISYQMLKAGPFRKVISHNMRKRRKGIRVLLLNGARKSESASRQKRLQPYRFDPSSKNNIWTSLIYDWTQTDRDNYLASRSININPVAKALCRSGECMCGTVQTKASRVEASVLFPHWGEWLRDLEQEAIRLHGFGWGEQFSDKPSESNNLQELFQPMCTDCLQEGI